jgi:hypothetical protein
MKNKTKIIERQIDECCDYYDEINIFKIEELALFSSWLKRSFSFDVKSRNE